MSHYWISLSVECSQSEAEELAAKVNELAHAWASRQGHAPVDAVVREDWLATSVDPTGSAGAEMANHEITSGPPSW